jgi:ubiquinone/menaquinone biosynthesis C-methylase UbiE
MNPNPAPQRPCPLAALASRTLEREGAFVLPWLRPGLDVLDLGCGPGTLTLDLAAAVLPGRATGLELSAAAIDTARRLAAGRELVNAQFLIGNPAELPYAESTFDLVFSHGLLDRMRRPHEVLEEIRRVLRPGGLAALASRRRWPDHALPGWELLERGPAHVISARL